MKEPSEAALRVAFGKAIRQLRHDRKLAQENLAALAQLDRAYMGGLERGKHAPTIITVRKIAHGLRITPAHIMREWERHVKYPPNNNANT
jgi:transcriptional regulator with XRE-family HTH domain